MTPNQDSYGEVINGKNTYNWIAKNLYFKSPAGILIGWTDELGSHLDILFTFNAQKPDGNFIQRGIRENDVFISIIGKGSFGFPFEENPNTSAGYYGEKLNINTINTTEKLADLLNAVRKKLYKIRFGQL